MYNYTQMLILHNILFYNEIDWNQKPNKNPDENPLLPMDFKILKKIIPQT